MEWGKPPAGEQGQLWVIFNKYMQVFIIVMFSKVRNRNSLYLEYPALTSVV